MNQDSLGVTVLIDSDEVSALIGDGGIRSGIRASPPEAII